MTAWTKSVPLAQKDGWESEVILTLHDDGTASIAIAITHPNKAVVHQQSAPITTPNMARDLAHELIALSVKLEEAND